LLAGADEVVFTDLGQALHDAYPGRKGLWLDRAAGHNTVDWRPGLARWLLLAGVGVLVVWFYLYLFAEGKTGPGLRWAYFQAYVREAMDWQWLATGRGFSREVPSPVVVPGLMPLAHSHNDIAPGFYSWGLPGRRAYAAFWFALLRLVFTRFVARGEYWPALALVAVIPNLVTDVGFHFFEKAAFLVILAAMCMACAPRRPTAS
jgi:hypothetical protein